MHNLKQVHQPENNVLRLRRLTTEDRKILALEFANLTDPRILGVNGSFHHTFYMRMVARIFWMATGDVYSSPYHWPPWADAPLDWSGWSRVIRIADKAVLESKWIPRGPNPAYRFVNKFIKRWAPWKGEGFHHLATALPDISEDIKSRSAEEIARLHPRPIHYKKSMAVWGRINLDNLSAKVRRAALEAAAGHFITDGDMRRFKQLYRQKAEHLFEIDLLPPVSEQNKESGPMRFAIKRVPVVYEDDGEKRGFKQKDGTYNWRDEQTDFEQVEEANGPGLVEWQYFMSEYSIRSAHGPGHWQYGDGWMDLERRFYRLSVEDRLTVEALLRTGDSEGGLDYEEAGKDLGIKKSALRKRVERIRTRVK